MFKPTLDTSDKNLGSGRLLSELGSLGVDRSKLGSLDGATLVNGVASDVHDTAERTRADGNHNGVASVNDLLAADETLST